MSLECPSLFSLIFSILFFLSFIFFCGTGYGTHGCFKTELHSRIFLKFILQFSVCKFFTFVFQLILSLDILVFAYYWDWNLCFSFFYERLISAVQKDKLIRGVEFLFCTFINFIDVSNVSELRQSYFSSNTILFCFSSFLNFSSFKNF